LPGAFDAGGWWFVLRGRELLLAADGGIPVGPCPVDCGTRQVLGELDGRPCYAVDLPEVAAAPPGGVFADPKTLLDRLPQQAGGMLARALEIIEWDRSHRFCGRCGTPTERKVHERSRVCPSCGQTHYPRLAPVAMALVTRGDELLLARSPHFPPGMMSVLAGFVEPGESLEECLVREVREEVGVEVDNLRYFSSQPWPFPHSLMVAFHCDYVSGEIVPQEGEIEAAGWFRIDDLPVLPHRLSIARRLIEDALARLRASRVPGT